MRNLRDSIPKAIGYFLVKSIQDTMQMKLYNQLNKSEGIISLLNEVKFILNFSRKVLLMKEVDLTKL